MCFRLQVEANVMKARIGAFAAFALLSQLSYAGATVSLDGEWTLDYFPEPYSGAVRTLDIPEHGTVKATVPGNCELDLARAGVLPPAEIGLNVRKYRDYEGYQWLYTRDFAAPDIPRDGRAMLVFEGIDTLADVFLNGEKIGEADNMFIAHRFDVTSRLRPGSNRVQVLIRSVMMDSMHQTLGQIGYGMIGGAEGEWYRKASFMGGWDIFPRLFVSGLWRGVRLEAQDAVRIDQTAWTTRIADVPGRFAALRGTFRLNAPFAYMGKAVLEARIERNGKVAAKWTRPMEHYQNSFGLHVQKPDFWWPRSMGESTLYDAVIEVKDSDGSLLARHSEKIGIRTIELERDDVYGPDRPGQFLFKVNGVPCYVRGTNWVPLDSMLGRSAEHLAGALDMVEDLNCNMVRIWGGGVYETDGFFDWCDAHGVMVWQDFMTACSLFPFHPDYQRRTREEAVEVVLRQRNHPSMALWSGNNENDNVAWNMLGRKISHWDPTEDITSRETLRRVVMEFDPTRDYLPSSPYFSPDVVAGKATASERHLWGVREAYKTPFYTNSPAHFASEMGYHGCPNRASLERMMTPKCVYPWTEITGKDPKNDYHWNEEWQLKASNPFLSRGAYLWKRNSLMTKQVSIVFGDVPTELDDFIDASQIVQAEAMKLFVEDFRSHKFNGKNGLIWWNLIDGWPQISDAVVDYWGGKKRAYFSIRAVQRDQLVMIRESDRGVVAVNDTLKPVKGSVRIADRESGKVVFEKTYEVPANAAAVIGEVAWQGQGLYVIEYEQGGAKQRNWFLYGEPPFALAKVRQWLEAVRETK